MLVPEEADALFTVPLAVDTVHVKLAPLGLDDSAIFVVDPEQTPAGLGVAVATGLLLTVIAGETEVCPSKVPVTVGEPPAVGVKVGGSYTCRIKINRACYGS
jgi:hypothetical protein